MRARSLVLFLVLIVLISVLFSAAGVTAMKKIVGLDGQVRSLVLSKSVPNQLNYQGFLANAADSSTVNATLEMTFRLFDTETKGAELWSETHSMVAVSEGLFQVLLGSITAFPSGLFDGTQLWLQTEVGIEVLTPRKPLVSVAYSQRTNSAEMLMDNTLTDLDDRWVNEADLDHLNAADGDPVNAVHVDDAGKVGIGTTSPLTELDVNGSVNANTYYGDGANLTGISGTPDADWTISGNDIYSALPGSVGVGTSSPENKLHVAGGVKADTYYGDGSNLTGISGTIDNDWTIDGDDVYHETGNVGVGTAVPEAKLHIVGDDTSGLVMIAPSRGMSGGNSELVLAEDDDGTYKMRLKYNGSNDQLQIFGGIIGALYGPHLVITRNDGAVGIGTEEPMVKQHIQDSDISLPSDALHSDVVVVEDGDAILGLYSGSSGSAGSAITLGEIAGTALVDKWAIVRETSGKGKGLRITYGTDKDQFANPIMMYLDDTGTVGIGTESPEAKLHVMGDTDNYGHMGSNSYGVYGEHGSSGNWGQLGSSGSGVKGSNASSGNFGSLGSSLYGVYGSHGASGNYGHLGDSDYGVYGYGNNYGVYGYSPDCGVYGYGATCGVFGFRHPGSSYGSLGDSSCGVYGYSDFSGYAGYFDGDVHIDGTLTGGKSATVIDHPLDPENKLLRHNFVESPENLLIYHGKIRLDGSGEADVEMPDYFPVLTREDEASIHLTPAGKPFLTGAEWNAGFQSFTIYGPADREVFWEVLADRDDPVTHQLGRPVEQDKGPENKLCDRGELLYPTAYGYPESMGKGYQEREEKRRFTQAAAAAMRGVD